MNAPHAIRRGALALAMAGLFAWSLGGPVDPAAACGGHKTPKCAAPDLKITKTGPVSIRFGETATYRIVVTNVGKVGVARPAIHVTDPAVTSDELVFASVVVGDTDTMLEPNEVWEYRLPGPNKPPVTITPTVCDPVSNTARVAGVKYEKYLDNNVSTATTGVICVPDLAITKVSDKATYSPGQSITYTITVTNAGPIAVPFAAIVVTDPTLPGLMLIGEPPVSLAPGARLTYSATRAVTTADCGTVSNTARVTMAPPVIEARSALHPEENLANNAADATVTVVCTPGIAIVKTADASLYQPGQTITYTVVVRNTGQTAIPFGQISVTDTALPNLTLVGAAPSSLAPGATLTYTGTRVAGVADCGTLGNTAKVTVSSPAPLNASAAVTVTVGGGACLPPDLNASLQITKSGPTAARARTTFVHSMRVTNTGFVTAKNVVVGDPVPQGLVVVTRPDGAKLVKGVVRWELGDLRPGENRVVSVALKTTFRGIATRCNVATADADNASPVTSRLCTRFAAVAGVGFTPPRVTG